MKSPYPLVAFVILACLGCTEAQDRVRTVTLPEGDKWFATHCGRQTQCFDDAKEICPGGYVTSERSTPKELFFTCKGKANW